MGSDHEFRERGSTDTEGRSLSCESGAAGWEDSGQYDCVAEELLDAGPALAWQEYTRRTPFVHEFRYSDGL